MDWLRLWSRKVEGLKEVSICLFWCRDIARGEGDFWGSVWNIKDNIKS